MANDEDFDRAQVRGNDWVKNTGRQPVPDDVVVWVKEGNGHVERGRAGDYWWGLDLTNMLCVKEWKLAS